MSALSRVNHVPWIFCIRLHLKRSILNACKKGASYRVGTEGKISSKRKIL